MSPFWTNTLIDVLLVIYVLDCLFMGLVIMMQRSKQEGLGAAFGGGFTESIWGAQTSNVLVKATVWAAAIFFVLSIVLARLYSSTAETYNQTSPVLKELTQPAAALPTPTNGAPALPAMPGAPTNSATPSATPEKPAAATTPTSATKPAVPTSPAAPAKK